MAPEDYEDLDEIYNEGIQLLNKEDDADIKKAAELFKKASSVGHIPSKRALGFMYLEGKGIPRDLNKAYKLISEAAAVLDPLALYALGRMYAEGLGVDQNDKEALRMFAFAAEMGLEDAEEDADRVMARITERRLRKLRSRPILNLEVSDADVEAVCCRPMFDAVINGEVEIVETYKGPELVREDENGLEVIFYECPFCGKKAKKVSKNKIY
jgi:hypothetical protein